MNMHSPAHPGEILKELILEPEAISIAAAARHLHVSPRVVSRRVHGQSSVTPQMALKLERMFDKPSADHWLRLQNAHDLWQVRQQRDVNVVPWAGMPE